MAGFALITCAIIWFLFASPLVIEQGFPFMKFQPIANASGVFEVSIAVSGVYLVYTWLIYHIFRSMHAPALVRFFARNSLLIFILHMPLYYLLLKVFDIYHVSYPARSCILILLCLGGTAFIAEFLNRIVPVEQLRSLVKMRFLYPEKRVLRT